MKLQVINYSKKIKATYVLSDLNLTFESGKVYGLYGRNGSGKTMLLRAISNLIFPTSGDVLIDGVSIIHDDFDFKQFGMMVDEPGFYPGISGIDNLNLLYTINNKSNKDYLINLMNEMGLNDVINKKYRAYSLGMKQKLRIIQAYMESQKIILFDEPTNALDEKSIIKFREKVKTLKQQDKLIIIASHNKDDLKILCDTIYHFEDGKCIGEIKL